MTGHHRVWVKWVNTGRWQEVAALCCRLDARDYAQNNISTSGGRISRIEIREPNAATGEAVFDSGWR